MFIFILKETTWKGLGFVKHTLKFNLLYCVGIGQAYILRRFIIILEDIETVIIKPYFFIYIHRIISARSLTNYA